MRWIRLQDSTLFLTPTSHNLHTNRMVDSHHRTPPSNNNRTRSYLQTKHRLFPSPNKGYATLRPTRHSPLNPSLHAHSPRRGPTRYFGSTAQYTLPMEWVTVSPLMGYDSVQPIRAGEYIWSGVSFCYKTSNPKKWKIYAKLWVSATL